MSEEWPKIVRHSTSVPARLLPKRKKGLGLHVGGYCISSDIGLRIESGMTIRSKSSVQTHVRMVAHSDRISAPWIAMDGVTKQLVYRSEHAACFKNGKAICLRRNYWTGVCSLILTLGKGRLRVFKYICFNDKYNPPTRQLAKQRLLQRTYNRYLKLVLAD